MNFGVVISPASITLLLETFSEYSLGTEFLRFDLSEELKAVLLQNQPMAF